MTGPCTGYLQKACGLITAGEAEGAAAHGLKDAEIKCGGDFCDLIEGEGKALRGDKHQSRNPVTLLGKICQPTPLDASPALTKPAREHTSEVGGQSV